MDPTAVTRFIVDALKDGDIPQAAMAMEDLESWLRKGGFSPTPKALSELMREILNTLAQLHRR